MEKREYLDQIKLLKRRISYHKDTLERYNELANEVPGPTYGKEVVQGTPSLKAPFIKYIDKIMEWEKRIAIEETELAVLVANTEEAISLIESEQEGAVLRLRYIFLLNWQDIAKQLHYSLASIYRYHNDGLEHFQVPQNKDDSK